MNAGVDLHPSDADLQDFTRGRLDARATRSLIDHLEECADCRKRAAELPDCTLNFQGASSQALAPASVQPPAPPADRPEQPSAASNAPADVPPELARQTGYQILKELGRGGMGVVYLARNLLMDRLEVLKVMSKELVGRKDAVERFVQEIRSAARLNHPNVATAYTTLTPGDLLVLAMEYVEGDDLAKVVKDHGRMPVPFACFCIREAALGLQRGHELGLVHRDIKPGNLILSQRGKNPVVKIVDFGLAKARAETPADHELTSTNQMMGTLGYTAPEQLCDARKADTRADIYSLGCTLYFLLAGGVPFKGNSAYEIFLAQEAEEFEPLQKLRPDVPQALAAVVSKMIAKDPANRFAEPAEVARRLQPFLEPGATPAADQSRLARGASGRVAGQAPRRVASDRRTEQAEDRSWPFVLLAGVAILAGILIPAAAFLFRRAPGSETVVVSRVPRDAEVAIAWEWPEQTRNGEVVTLRGVHPGSHHVTVTRNGEEIWSRDFTIPPNSQPLRLVVELSQSPRPAAPRWPLPPPAPLPVLKGGADTLGGDRPPNAPLPSRPPPPPLIPDAPLEHAKPMRR